MVPNKAAYMAKDLQRMAEYLQVDLKEPSVRHCSHWAADFNSFLFLFFIIINNQSINFLQ